MVSKYKEGDKVYFVSSSVFVKEANNVIQMNKARQVNSRKL